MSMFWISWFDSFACRPEEPRNRFSRTTGASEPGYNRVGGNVVLMWRKCQEENRESGWITTQPVKSSTRRNFSCLQTDRELFNFGRPVSKEHVSFHTRSQLGWYS